MTQHIRPIRQHHHLIYENLGSVQLVQLVQLAFKRIFKQLPSPSPIHPPILQNDPVESVQFGKEESAGKELLENSLEDL